MIDVLTFHSFFVFICSEDPRRASMFVESTQNMSIQEHGLRSSSSMDRLNMISGGSSGEKVFSLNFIMKNTQ